MEFVSVILFASVVLTVVYYYMNHRHRYWSRRKIPFIKPSNFIMGSTADVLLKKISLYEYHAKMYDQLTPHKYGGYYNFLTPVLIIRDPELVKTIFTKDFHYFMNRGTEPLDENDPLSQHLFNLKGEKWKALRAKITPAFSSGKMKIMFGLMKACTDDLFDVINAYIEKSESVEIKETMARFTTDVISSCVFGLQSNSQKDPNSIFRIMGRKTFQPTTRMRVLSILYMLIPKLRGILKIPLLDKDIGEFFKSIVTKTIKYREDNTVARNDFLDLLIALKKHDISSRNTTTGVTSQLEFTDNLLTAQCFVFFVAGFETSSGTLTYALFELAKHPEIQKTLLDEIVKILDENDGSVDYECLQRMSYLDQVICEEASTFEYAPENNRKMFMVMRQLAINHRVNVSSLTTSHALLVAPVWDMIETLRMYPLLPALSRICSENYQLDEHFVIEKNTRVVVPVKGLHYDPSYFENPAEFNPENFSKETKSRRHHFAFLPFGEGPRICIGMRFGMMQVKLGLVTLIRNYSVSLAPNMTESINYVTTTFLPTPKDGVWLQFQKR